MKHTTVFLGILFVSLGSCLLQSEGVFDFAQALQTLVSSKKSIDVILLEEIRQLPQAPTNYPVAQHFTATLLLHTAEQCARALKDQLMNAEWLSGGTYDYLFVRKLVLPDDAVVAFRGDLHGDVHSLIRWLDVLRADGWFEKENPLKLTTESLEKNRYLAFLGDYVDRGHYGAEVMYIIMRLLVENPNNVLIVRGNHEDQDIIAKYGYQEELKKKFSFDYNDIATIIRMYDYLPVAIFLGCENGKGGNDFVQCCHGGMEPGYHSQKLLEDGRDNLYQRLDEKLDIKDDYRGRQACKRMPHLQVDLVKSCLCTSSSCSINGFQWNDFDFFNENPDLLINFNSRGSYDVHKKYATELLKTSTFKKSDNHVWCVFRAHQHNSETIPHILRYGNGLYRLWSDKTTDSEQWKGSQNKQWSGINGDSVRIEKYSVWTFNVAPRTGYYDKVSKDFNYDTVAELHLAKGFNNWKLYPRKIPVS